MGTVLALADDLTGALEVGAKFAGHGIVARVSTMWDAAAETPVLVVDTESRHLAGADAAAAVSRVARRHHPELVYKKTDSTLRGNIGAELAALAEAFPGRPLVYAPAYPELGRTVRDGRLYVHGTPVHETTFAHDPLNPIRESDVRRAVGDLVVTILDGETTADVALAARTIFETRPMPVAVGPAALAAALAEALDLPRGDRRPWPKVSRCLVVNGSLHPASTSQVACALAAGWRRAQPGCAPGALARGGWYVLNATEIRGDGLERARRLGGVVREIVARSQVDALIVFGGDTAYGIHQALGSEPFDPYGELASGVPLAESGGRFWITKAGGFGSAEILCDIRSILS